MKKASQNSSVCLCHLAKYFRAMPRAVEVITDFRLTPTVSESEMSSMNNEREGQSVLVTGWHNMIKQERQWGHTGNAHFKLQENFKEERRHIILRLGVHESHNSEKLYGIDCSPTVSIQQQMPPQKPAKLQLGSNSEWKIQPSESSVSLPSAPFISWRVSHLLFPSRKI